MLAEITHRLHEALLDGAIVINVILCGQRLHVLTVADEQHLRRQLALQAVQQVREEAQAKRRVQPRTGLGIAGCIQIVPQLRIAAGAHQQVGRPGQGTQGELPVDNVIGTAAHRLQGRRAPGGLVLVPGYMGDILALRPQGFRQVVLAFHAAARRGAAKVGGYAVVGILEGETLHPAGEWRLPEEDEVFGGVRYGVIDTIAVHSLRPASLPA